MSDAVNTSTLLRCPASMALPAWGLYRGALREGPATPRLPVAAARHKRWIYLGVYAPEVVVGLAVVDLGFGANAFAYAGPLDGGAKGAWDVVAAPWEARVSRTRATWKRGARRVELALPAEGVDGYARLRLDDAEVELTLSAPYADSAVTCVAPARPGTSDRWNLTVKDNTLRARGTVRWGDARHTLDCAAISDVTDAYPARVTVWNWASLAGLDARGRAVGVNLCALHNDSALARENVLWLDGAPHPLGAVRFDFDRAALDRAPWRVRGDGVDLRFEPSGARVGDEDLGLVVSRFAQPYGRFSGTVRAGGEDVTLEGVPGVMEDHEARW